MVVARCLASAHLSLIHGRVMSRERDPRPEFMTTILNDGNENDTYLWALCRSMKCAELEARKGMETPTSVRDEHETIIPAIRRWNDQLIGSSLRHEDFVTREMGDLLNFLL